MPLPLNPAELSRRGLSYAQYLALMERQAAAPVSDLSEEEAQRVEFTKLNLHRSGRISRTYRPTPELAKRVLGLAMPQLWLVLTEPWCGDSAQCLPYLVKLAEESSGITLSILLRDDNLEVMDQYLTAGKRGIPRLIAFAADGDELFRWGPRPAAAQVVFDAAKAEGLAKPELLGKLHLWYGRNRGEALETELTGLFSGLSGGCG